MLLSNKEDKFVAKASQYAQESTMYSRHSCVVVLNGVEIASGYNNIRTYSKDGFINECYSCHAEISALRNAVKRSKLLPYERKHRSFMKRICMYVVRIDSNNQYVDSQPCQQCSIKLKRWGVRRVIYSDGTSFTRTNFSEINEQSSSGYKFIKKTMFT